MGQYLRDARRHAERIEYYDRHAGTAGYAQAEYHWNTLSELMSRASCSRNDKSDAPVIAGIIDSSRAMMDAMRAKASADAIDSDAIDSDAEDSDAEH